jgi:uncharacterized protein YciI
VTAHQLVFRIKNYFVSLITIALCGHVPVLIYNLQINKMFKPIVFFLLFIAGVKASAQTDNPKYDKALADSLGADEYGMKMYVLVILKTGPNKMEDKAKRDSLFQGHMDNITRLVKMKKLVVAGPLEKNEANYRGIFILDVKTLEEARSLVDTDPTIKEKVLDVDMFLWYGSAALPLYLPFHEKMGKKTF